MDKKGKLIVFEGLDGAGTTTQMYKLAQYFTQKGSEVFITHEPTDNPIGRLVRSALQKKFSITPNSLALLYAADRDDHLYNKEYGIISHLQNGEVVITDRYFYSSIAYQAVECDPSFIKEINSRFPHPDILIFIDTPVDDCLKRIEKRGEEKELFEREWYLKKVKEKYDEEFSSLPRSVKLITIDGRKTIEEISEEIREKIERL